MMHSYHGLHGSADTMLMANTLSYGKWWNLNRHRIKTASLFDIKLWICDCIWEICPQIKCCNNRCNGDFWGDGWNITSILFIPIFFSHRLQVRPVDRFLHAVAQQTWTHSGMCLLGVITIKLISNFYIFTKTIEIMAKRVRTIFSTERLTIGRSRVNCH